MIKFHTCIELAAYVHVRRCYGLYRAFLLAFGDFYDSPNRQIFPLYGNGLGVAEQ